MNHTLALPSHVASPHGADFFGPEAVLRDIVSGTRLAVLDLAADSATVGTPRRWRRALLAQIVHQPGPLLLGLGLAVVAGSRPGRLPSPDTPLKNSVERIVSLLGEALGIALVAAGTLIIVLRHPRLLVAL